MQTSGLSLSQRAAEPDSGDASISRGGGRRVGRPSKLPPAVEFKPRKTKTRNCGVAFPSDLVLANTWCAPNASAEVAKGEKTEKDVQKKEEDFVGFVV